MEKKAITVKMTKTERVGIVILLMSLILFLISSIFRNQALRHVFQLSGNAMLIIVAGKRVVKQRLSLISALLLCYTVIDVLLVILSSPFERIIEQTIAGISFISFVIILASKSIYTLTEKENKIIITAIILFSLASIIEINHPNAYVFEDGRTNGALALGTTSSAYLGMMLSGIINILSIYYVEKKRKRWYLLLLMLIMLWFLWLTHSRGAFLATIVVMIYSVFFVKKRINKLFVNFCLMFPFMTMLIFPYLDTLAAQGISFLGKPLSSGRAEVYYEEMRLLKTPLEIIIGNRSGYSFGNSHNGYLMIITSVGVIGMVLLYVFLNKTIKRFQHELFSYKGKTALVALLSVFIMSGIEALPLMGRFPFSLYIYIYFLIIYSELHRRNIEIGSYNGVK